MTRLKIIIMGMLLTAFFWGSSFRVIKNLNQILESEVQVFLRFAIAFGVMGFIWLGRSKKEYIKKEDLKSVLFNGILGGAIYFGLSQGAVAILPHMDSSMISATQPILMIIVESLILGTVFSSKQSIIVALGVIGGIICVETVPIYDIMRGYSMQFIATLGWVAYYFTQKPLVKKYRIETLLMYQFGINALILIPLIRGNIDQIVTVMSNGQELGNILFLGVACTAIGYGINSYALRWMTPTFISIFLNLVPIVNLAIERMVSGERLRMEQIMGSLLVIASVCFMTKDLMKSQSLENSDIQAALKEKG